jgi:hypothetical protein
MKPIGQLFSASGRVDSKEQRLRALLIPVGLGVLYLTSFVLFLMLKLSYKGFCLERVFRDTLGYVKVAELPFLSASFWAAERSFSLPLMYKFLGVNSLNFELPATMSMVAGFQTWFSIVCWTLLAAAVAVQLRNRWLRPLAFALVLVFSASLEISLWDTLMLSESLSLSLFVLICAGWLVWIQQLNSPTRTWSSWLLIFGQIVATILYTFVRDSNIYFGLIGAVLIAAGIFFKKLSRTFRIQAAVYTISIVVVLMISNLNISAGNRWQIFIYDQLALNILPDPAAREFFVREGLPINESLMSITTMVGYQYQDLLENAPEYKTVNTWVNQNSKTAYLKYLAYNPVNSLLEPISNANKMINPNTIGYLYPRFPLLPYPIRIRIFSQVFYPNSLFIAIVLLLLTGICSIVFWIRGNSKQPAWLFVSILVFSIYPLMFLIWHGEPMEVERHAAQLGVQLRLAGWVSLALLIDSIPGAKLLETWRSKRKQS